MVKRNALCTLPSDSIKTLDEEQRSGCIHIMKLLFAIGFIFK